MKNLKFKMGGGAARKVAAIITAILISAVLPLNTFAANDPSSGAETNYRSSEIETSTNQHVKFTLNSYPDYIGLCCEFGVVEAASGTATPASVGNTSNFAKAAYYFGIVKGWQDSIGQGDGSNAYTLQCILQQLNNTFDPIINNPGEWSAVAVDLATRQKAIAVNALENNPEWESVSVPASFKVFKCNAGSDQDFLIWKTTSDEGKIKLKKVSANPGITG